MRLLATCDLLGYYPLGHGKLISNPKSTGVSSRYGKTRAQVAVRWLAEKNNVFPIPRASAERHVKENVSESG